jgi:hypothetical protein
MSTSEKQNIPFCWGTWIFSPSANKAAVPVGAWRWPTSRRFFILFTDFRGIRGIEMKKILILTILAFAGLQQTTILSQGSDMNQQLLLDDFSGQRSALGTLWEGFTDQVMGGVSEMNARIESEGDNSFLHLSGNVSLDNNGGFIQVRLPLDPQKRSFDASGYTGIALRVRGKDQGYYVHLRTSRTIFPWSYYAQEFPVSEEWTTVTLPFSDFEPENMRPSSLNTSKLTSVAIVAAKKAFFADVYVDSVYLYR